MTPPIRAAVHARPTTSKAGPGGAGRNNGTGGTASGPGPESGGNKGGTGGGEPTEVKISTRFFRPSGGNEVTAVFRADSPFKGYVRILLIGEDGATHPIQIEGCFDSKGRKATFSGSEIINVTIRPGQTETYRLRIREKVQGGLTAEGFVKP